MDTPREHIRVSGLEMRYGPRVIQRGLDFAVMRGDIFVIMGGSGCGKSTLLKHMIGLYEPAAGEVFYNMLADRVDNAEAADLLRKNAVEERGHARRLARMISIKIGQEWEPTPEVAELLAVPLPDQIGSKIFAGVVQGEINGDAGYQRWADAESDEEVVRLLRLNGREETIHAGRAQQVFDLLNA